MQNTQTYQERSRAFLVKAREELDSGDLEQASEKGWGAAALMVKAVAEQRGLEHKTHRHLFHVVSLLVDEAGNSNIGSLFDTANQLHINFYEDWLTADDLKWRLAAIGDFVELVERRLHP